MGYIREIEVLHNAKLCVRPPPDPSQRPSYVKAIPQHGCGHYKFCNMHIGLKSAMITFQILINAGMAGIIGIKRFYMGYITITRETLEWDSGALV
jgi:hypothetical protein